MFINSNTTGYKDDYNLRIECNYSGNDLYCILSKCDYQQERIESEADFISYPSGLKIEIAFKDFSSYSQALLALLNSLSVELYKNGLIWFKGYIENSEDITYSAENRVISLTVVSNLLKLKETNKSELPNEYFSLTFRTWKFKDIIRDILLRIGMREIIYLDTGSIRGSLGLSYGLINFDDLEYDIRYACLNYDGETVWDILKLVCNLLLIEINIVGDRAIISNRYLYNNQTPVILDNNDLSIDTEYSYRKLKNDFCVKSWYRTDYPNTDLYKNVRARGSSEGESIEVFVGGGTANSDSDYRFCLVYYRLGGVLTPLPYGLIYNFNSPISVYRNATSRNIVDAHWRQCGRNLISIRTSVARELVIYDFYKIGNLYYKIADYSYSIIDGITSATFLQTIP